MNCVVGGSSSCVNPTEVGTVDADVADTDPDADGDAADPDAISAMAEM